MGTCRYWTVALDGAKVSGRAVALGATTAIMDSGTTAILVSSADAAAIHQVRAWHTAPGCHALHEVAIRGLPRNRLVSRPACAIQRSGVYRRGARPFHHSIFTDGMHAGYTRGAI